MDMAATLSKPDKGSSSINIDGGNTSDTAKRIRALIENVNIIQWINVMKL